MLYLNQTELATEEDISNNLVYWAKMLKATNWEELKDVAKNSPVFEEVAKVMYNSNIQPQEKTIMEAHEKYMMDKRSLYSLGLKEGIEQGIEQGREESKAEIERLKKLLEEAGISAK